MLKRQINSIQGQSKTINKMIDQDRILKNLVFYLRDCEDCERLEIGNKEFSTMDLKEVFKYLTRLNQSQKFD